jgi:hypothetical protein
MLKCMGCDLCSGFKKLQKGIRWLLCVGKILNVYEWYEIIDRLSNYQLIKQVLLIIELISEEAIVILDQIYYMLTTSSNVNLIAL